MTSRAMKTKAKRKARREARARERAQREQDYRTLDENIIKVDKRKTRRKQEIDTTTPQQIHVTTDYSQFKISKVNRPISEPKIEAIVESMQKKRSWMSRFPILVNSDFEVQDGQHRLTAALIVKAPVHYIVCDEITQDDVILLNENTKSWTWSDYLHHYVARGLDDYVELEKFYKEYGLNLKVCIILLSGKSSSSTGKIFTRGLFKVEDIKQARELAQYVLDFKDYGIHRHMAFATAMKGIALTEGYDHSRMMQKVEMLSERIHKCPSKDDYILMLARIYNWKTQKKNIIDFGVHPSLLKW